MMVDVSVDFCIVFVFFFFKQKTAYEMRISDWSSDVCSSDLNATTSGRDFPGAIQFCMTRELNRPRAIAKSLYGASGCGIGRGNRPMMRGMAGSFTSMT